VAMLHLHGHVQHVEGRQAPARAQGGLPRGVAPALHDPHVNHHVRAADGQRRAHALGNGLRHGQVRKARGIGRRCRRGPHGGDGGVELGLVQDIALLVDAELLLLRLREGDLRPAAHVLVRPCGLDAVLDPPRRRRLSASPRGEAALGAHNHLAKRRAIDGRHVGVPWASGLGQPLHGHAPQQLVLAVPKCSCPDRQHHQHRGWK